MFLFKKFDSRSLFALLTVFTPPFWAFPLRQLPLFLLSAVSNYLLFFIKVNFLLNRHSQLQPTSPKSRKSSFEDNDNLFVKSKLYYFFKIDLIFKIASKFLFWVRTRETLFLNISALIAFSFSVDTKIRVFLFFFLVIRPIFLMIERYHVMKKTD